MHPYRPWHRIGLAWICVGLTACFHYAEQPTCARGQQSVDGHCLPTPTIVFTRCVEAFRTDSVEHDRGREIDVGARAASGVGGNVRHHEGQSERREFSGLSEDHMAAAIAECRRQEEAEREGQLARAWEETERARAEADAARLEARQARWALERLARQSARARGKDDDEAPATDAEAGILAELPRPPGAQPPPGIDTAEADDAASADAPADEEAPAWRDGESGWDEAPPSQAADR